jgi:hypothetical protein
MPLSRGWNSMNAAFTPYEDSAGPGSGVTGGHKRLCGTTGTAARQARPFTINKRHLSPDGMLARSRLREMLV